MRYGTKLDGDRFQAGMEIVDAVDFARTSRQSVLTTIRKNGRPQLSNVLHHVFDDGTVRISITADRAKYRNLSREPWAALHVTREDFFAYVVLEGEERVPTRTLIWAAGVKANALTGVLDVELGPGGRIVVDEGLAIPGRPGGWART